ncbi:MAG: glucose-6-phosphate dehydrogenase assembly protein OpcA [Candidatus Eisenbacteria bacterium]|nr:glucose-6-phosphate dehydrogenase assembly protein OpcA [Candidatus Eisenbacteria bacterium]
MTSGALRPLVEGGRKPVDVAAIEAELAALWRSAADPDAGGAVTRACLWNVVAHSQDGVEADRLHEALARLSAALPSRVVLVRTDAGAPEEHIDAWIAANCHLGEGGRGHVCTEEIVVAARGRTMSELPSLVRSLLAPDVPSVLLWPGPPSIAGRHLAEWLGVADRFVFDSAAFGPGPELGGLLAVVRSLARPPALGDLNWRRLRPWRVMTARAYDRPGLREALQDADTLTVRAPAGGLPRAAALFAAWFATRLGRPVSRGNFAGLRGGPVRVVPEDAPEIPGRPGRIVSIEFRAGQRSVEFAREGPDVVVRTSGPGMTVSPLREPTRGADLVMLLASELDDYCGDPLLAAALPAAATLVE